MATGRPIVTRPEGVPWKTPAAPVVVAEDRSGTFLNRVDAGRHHFVVDEPAAVGGFDAGPSPYDLLAAALGACTSMTLRLYADRKHIALDRVIVEVDHGREHTADCEHCAEGGAPSVDVFRRRIHLEGRLGEADRTRLLAIANRCPVHRTLETSSRIETELV
jgi:putative redox protein